MLASFDKQKAKSKKQKAKSKKQKAKSKKQKIKNLDRAGFDSRESFVCDGDAYSPFRPYGESLFVRRDKK
ncbi:hypothetical protein F3J45_29960 [Pantoea sp. Ap-967]|uniref:hypothetical protein n=1 Tax=Pantoea sp. Ap-967 TaxID=2608362 RepID=UPI0014203D4B|nr:hypothetical protein [Pantoea sp. Ap-967]NIE78640.1 hypothetical protein [Pantoea sp. Ap-967]